MISKHQTSKGTYSLPLKLICFVAYFHLWGPAICLPVSCPTLLLFCEKCTPRLSCPPPSLSLSFLSPLPSPTSLIPQPCKSVSIIPNLKLVLTKPQKFCFSYVCFPFYHELSEALMNEILMKEGNFKIDECAVPISSN